MPTQTTQPTKPTNQTTPPIQPLHQPTQLAGNPTRPPLFPTTITDQHGKPITLADPRATRALIALMNTHAVNGGAACHWGGPAALAETMSALHAILFRDTTRPWHQNYNFINDAGHTENGLYALRANLGYDNLTLQDLRHFRSIQSKLTGHGESHLNPQAILLSNGPLSSAIAQAQGLALGDRLTKRNRTTILTISDGAAMEGEAKEAFASIPGLAAKNKLNPFIMIISDNNTKLTGRIDQDAFDMAPTLDTLPTLGWNTTTIQDGHNLQTIYTALEQATQTAQQNPQQPIALRIKTIKGYGIQATQQSPSGGHGFPLKNAQHIIDYITEIWGSDNIPPTLHQWAQQLHQQWQQTQNQETKTKTKPQTTTTTPPIKTAKIQTGLANAAIQALQQGHPIYSISSDVQGSTGISALHKQHPNHYTEVGVAEANMISIAAGLAKTGLIPIVDTFGQFGITKGNLPLTMAALSQAPIIAIFSHIGFQDAADGASHQATTYFAAVSAIPHTTIIAPSCADEAQTLMTQTIQHYIQDRKNNKTPQTTIFFVGRENYPTQWTPNPTYPWHKAQTLQTGKDITIIACGPLLGQAIQATQQLKQQNIHPTLINNPFINQPDIQTIAPLIQQTNNKIITIEDHQTIGGMSAQLSHALSQNNTPHTIKTLAIQGTFGQSAYTANQLYQKHNLTAQAITHAAQQLINQPQPK